MSKIREIANECGLTGLKRVVFYIAAPFVMVVSYMAGYIRGIIDGIKKHH